MSESCSPFPRGKAATLTLLSAVLRVCGSRRLNSVLETALHEFDDTGDVLIPVNGKVPHVGRVLKEDFLHGHAPGTAFSDEVLDGGVGTDLVLIRVEEQVWAHGAGAEKRVVGRQACHEAAWLLVSQRPDQRVEDQPQAPKDSHSVAGRKASIRQLDHRTHNLPEGKLGGAAVKGDTTDL